LVRVVKKKTQNWCVSTWNVRALSAEHVSCQAHSYRPGGLGHAGERGKIAPRAIDSESRRVGIAEAHHLAEKWLEAFSALIVCIWRGYGSSAETGRVPPIFSEEPEVVLKTLRKHLEENLEHCSSNDNHWIARDARNIKKFGIFSIRLGGKGITHRVPTPKLATTHKKPA